MLKISGLTKVYNQGTRALDDISMDISKGMFGLLGPNGAGKSTLMRILATLDSPTSGKVELMGFDIHQNPQKLRAQLGYLPQDFGVYAHISAWQLLDHLAILKGIFDSKERKEQVSGLLQQTNLYEVRKKAVSTFSGGMRQRFGIAQALLGNPRLILVDEPTAGLDPEERNRFHNLLSEIGEQVVVILSTHIVEDVRELCPKMAIMANGKVLLQGSPVHLIETLKGQIWRKNIERKDLPHYQSHFSVISTRLFAGKMQIHVLADQCPSPDFESLSPDLEDVYFSILFGAQSLHLSAKIA